MNTSHVEGHIFDYFPKSSLRTVICSNKWIKENMYKSLIYQIYHNNINALIIFQCIRVTIKVLHHF